MTRAPTPPSSPPRRRSQRALFAALSLAAGFALWLPCVHRLYPTRVRDEAFIAEQQKRWSRPDPADERVLRGTNAEWDLMSRVFSGAALLKILRASREPSPARLAAIDRLIDRLLDLERREGHGYFLLPYGRRGGWLQRPQRSQFVDGEIAWLIGLRRRVADDRPELRRAFRQRIAAIMARMERSPTLSAESYPDECWTFCNTIALAALALAEELDGAPTAQLRRRWIARAKEVLLDPETGLLVASYHLDGRPKDGPEGSSIWLAVTMLARVDGDFAQAQYELARAHLGRTLLGFGYAREWPVSATPRRDVDSGLVLPLLGASPSASAFALLAARTFGDRPFAEALARSLEIGAYPVQTKVGRRFAASNSVGDAVLLLAQATPLPELWRR